MTKQEFKRNYTEFRWAFLSFFNSKFTIKKNKVSIKAIGEHDIFLIKKDMFYSLSKKDNRVLFYMPLKLARQLDAFEQFFELIDNY